MRLIRNRDRAQKKNDEKRNTLMAVGFFVLFSFTFFEHIQYANGFLKKNEPKGKSAVKRAS